ncbi:MAG: hypothetical protein ACTSQE_10275 [Candidatus Heimdallarchaeaceae archaeon]
MKSKNKIKKVEYNCNLCLKSRVLVFPKSVTFTLDNHGLVDIVDIHNCKDSKMNAILLNVDAHLNVRSQNPVYSATEKAVDVGIPSPKKVEFSKRKIEQDHLKRLKNIKDIKIKDLIRHTIFYLESVKPDEKDKHIEVNSDLAFIQINVTLSKNISEDVAKEWLQNLTNIIEKTVYFVEADIVRIIAYLDTKIKTKMQDEDYLILKFLIRSSTSIPLSNKEQVENFNANWNDVFPDLTVVDYKNYSTILEECLDNNMKTISDIYENTGSTLSFPDFILIIAKLISKELIELYDFKFVNR